MRYATLSIITLFAISTLFTSSFAQTTTITPTTPTTPALTITTDKSSYVLGDTIIVSGQVQAVVPKTPLTIQVFDSKNNLIFVDQIDVTADGKYTDIVNAKCTPNVSCLWVNSGTFTINAQYGIQTVKAQTTFSFQGSATPISNMFQVKDPNSQQTFDVNYTISGGNVKDMTIDIQSISLIVSINSTSDGTITLQIPRTLVDAKTSNGQDDAFIILIDGAEVKSQSESANSNYRTLTIPFLQGDQDIEIIGTQVVPEFGPIAALVLAIAIISIIAVSAKTGQRFMPKY